MTTDLNEIYEAFGIGEKARTMSVLLANIFNAKRRSACLSAIEREFFTVEVESDEPEDMGMPAEQCLLNWGSNPEAYVEQFREALATRAAAPNDTLSPHERVLFETTVDQFAGCNETDTDYAVLMDWARRGFLECVHFEVTAKANTALAASAPTVKP